MPLRWIKTLSSETVRVAADAQGATAIEYAVVAGFISATVIGTVFTLGETVLNELFLKIAAGVAH